MKYLIFTVVAWFLATLDVSAMPFIKVLGVSPNLVLILAACWAVIRGDDEAIVVVPIAAIVTGLFSSDPFGTALLAFAPIVPLAAATRIRAIDSDFLPTLAVVAIGTVTFLIIQMLVLALTGQNVELTYALTRLLIPAAVVNCLFTPIIYLPIRWASPERSSVMRGAGRLTSPL